MATKCGAKNRAGQPCQKWAIKGKRRCANHGGKSVGPPKGTRNNLKHGIYSSGLMPGEAQIWGDIPVGSLDDEIKLAKLQLRRALMAQQKINEQPRTERGLENDAAPVGMELSEIRDEPVRENSGGRTVTHKRPDYRSEIYRLLGRVKDLEAARALILQANGGGGDAKTLAEELREFQREAERVTSGPADA
jgi:hypothetical protein